MTEDPVKLYVVVMSILLVVLGFVAYSSYKDADAYEQALLRAPGQSRKLKEYASEVGKLCEQIGKSTIGQGEITLITQAANRTGVKTSSVRGPQKKALGRGRRGKEHRWSVSFGGSGSSNPLTREKVARFCQAVERDSQGILKTIEIDITRMTGKGLPDLGKEDKVTTDLYRGTIVFGKRVVE